MSRNDSSNRILTPASFPRVSRIFRRLVPSGKYRRMGSGEDGRVHVRLDLDYYDLDFGNDDASGASLDEPWVIGLGFLWGFGGE